MTQSRFTCILTRTGNPCQSYARVSWTVRAPQRAAVPARRGRARWHHRRPAWTGPTPGASTSGSARPLSCPRN